MEITPVFAFKVFVSATAVAGLIDMYILQKLKHYSNRFHSEEFANRNLRLVNRLSILRYFIGDNTISFMKTRTIIFPAFELIFGTVVLVGLYIHGLNISFLRILLFLIIALPLAMISALDDPDQSIAPNSITYPGITIGLFSGLIANKSSIALPSKFIEFFECLMPNNPVTITPLLGLISSLLGILVAGGVLWLIRELYWRIRHVEGMGLGAVKTAAMIGAFCTYQGAIASIIIANLLAVIIYTPLAFRNRSGLPTMLPFTSFLVAGGVIVMLSRP